MSLACAGFVLALTSIARAEEPRDRYFFDAYVDFYYYHDYHSLEGKNQYLVTPRREGLPSVNLAHLSGEVAATRWRGRFAIQDGTSVDAAYSGEEGDWRHVQEAYAGGQIAEGLWLDAGVFLSHLGSDGFVIFDNWALSRSLLGDHTALYESGARAQYRPGPNLDLSLYALHGWENISGGRDLAGGWRFAFTKGDWTYRYGGFLGNEDGRRAYNEIVLNGRLSETVEVSLHAGAGYQKRLDAEDSNWHGASVSLRQRLSKKLSSIYRFELFSDPDSVVSSRSADEGLRAGGFTFALDFALLKGAAAWRSELRILKSRDDIFESRASLDDLDSYIATALIISL